MLQKEVPTAVSYARPAKDPEFYTGAPRTRIFKLDIAQERRKYASLVEMSSRDVLESCPDFHVCFYLQNHYSAARRAMVGTIADSSRFPRPQYKTETPTPNHPGPYGTTLM